MCKEEMSMFCLFGGQKQPRKVVSDSYFSRPTLFYVLLEVDSLNRVEMLVRFD